MARLTTDGMETFLQALNAVGEKAEGAAKRCVYSAAAEVKNALEEEIRSLPLDDREHFIPGRDPLRVISEQDRADMIDCIGISGIRKEADGTIQNAVSFDGYISRKEDKYPAGVPAALIARSLQIGTSVRAKDRFITRAVAKARKKAPEAMQAALDEAISYTLTHTDTP